MRIKYKFIMGLVLIVFMLSAGIVYSQGSFYSDPQGRFSFNLPAGWKADVSYDSGFAAYFTYSAQEGIIGELIIIIEGLTINASVDQYAEMSEENGFKQLPGYKPGTQLPTTVFGLPAIKKNFTFNSQTGLILRAEAYMFVSGNYAYTIFLDVLTDYFAQVQPGFTQTMASFKVQSGAPVVVQPAPQPAITLPTTPAPNTSDVGGAPPAPNVPVAPTQPIIPTPAPAISAMPVQPPVTSGMIIYTDPQGRFSIPIPAGSTAAQTTEMGVILNTPDGAVIFVWHLSSGEQYVQAAIDQITTNQQFHGKSQLQAGNRQALVELYSKVNPQDNINYATIIVTYPGTPLIAAVKVPADKYNQAQTWIIEMIKGGLIK